ncbi:transcriptional regulator [Streptomyces triticagri]|uniref:Transcriptional regulator n=1 Tax=Streptomyces triticagri TaxID=2293568 RepID=A0A372LZN5_9ACTN|nr:ArsR family transcriptional regulator [Streptomyces triticagri]RFU84154.1 transcriptional regulator [Streptomyces triticagri]
MIDFVLGVEDLADTRFAMSPLHETVLSLRVLREPGLSAIHLPWRRAVLERITARDGAGALDAEETDLLRALVARRRTIPDFLTPRPETFAPSYDEQLAEVRRVPPERVRRDLVAAHAPDPLPPVLQDAVAGTDESLARFRDGLCDVLARYWNVALAPQWRQMRLVLEADMTYRARQLAVGGARSLFADMHPNLRWRDGVLQVRGLIGPDRSNPSRGGLLLLPSVFAHKPTPPLDPGEPPRLLYPSRGVATLWTAPEPVDAAALGALLGAPRTRLLLLLETPLATVEIARRLRVTPSAVSQHLRVLHATGLVTRARDGRQVLYRRSGLGDRLAEFGTGTGTG